ncbi:MAG TPA: hypothetical protein VF483_12970 [Gemmatimonadaceae bacterium]
MAPELAASPFATWESFYVIVGSSAAGLTGLMFVVVSLMPGTKMKGNQETLDAYATPTVVHFSAALLVSAIMSAPWKSAVSAGLMLTLLGIAGIAYVIIVIRRARRQKAYKEVLEDVLFHWVFPMASYATLAFEGGRVATTEDAGLFGIAAAVMGLLFIGIHNAWDTVAFIAARHMAAKD